MIAGDGQEVGLDAKQLLLRGATLRKTRWVVGMAVYSGLQTKLQVKALPFACVSTTGYLRG